MPTSRKALGRGFTALIPSGPKEGAEFLELSLGKIIPNRYQPRKVFRREELSELSISLKAKGAIQPIVVRKVDSDKYELIAGERRWRAAQMAGLSTLPAWVREVPEEELLDWALIENLHREDLNPVEMAQAYRRLMTERGLTQEQVAERVGQERSTVANFLRLLTLPMEILEDLAEGRLSMGHAKAILSVGGPEAQLILWRRITSEKLSVRQAEGASRPSARTESPAKKPPEVTDLEEKLSRSLGTRVRIQPRGKGGKITVEYYSLEELDRLIDRFV
ncbi:MAG TPA: ParB/RepB/Spo0J family partition protein [Nitrospiria bacterium]|nr:ParB/RepB/Spo0J family partition protein [Nitrospiria bacterium]